MQLKLIMINLFIFLSALFFPLVAASAEVVHVEGVTVWADALSYDKGSDTYRGTGNVMIVWNEAILIADNVTLTDAGNEAVAEGRVRLVKGSEVLHGDRIMLHLLTDTWEVTNGNFLSRTSNFHIKGQKMEKVGEDKYRLERGSFTTCDGENPSWKFTSSNMDVTLEDFATGKNDVFYIKDIPLLYTPYLLFPVNRERQTGLLIPSIGNSTKKGFNIDIPFYWAISPSQELTADLDLMTRRGAGIGLEYNYRRPNDSLGKLQGFYIYDTSQDKNRANLITQQQEWLSPSLVFKSDVNLVTDRDFFHDFAEASGEYNRQILDSSVSLTKNWQNYSLAGEFRYVDNLVAPSNRLTLQKLPSIDFTAIRQKVPGTPLYLALDSSFVNFYHEDGIRGQRLDFHPFATVYLPMPAGLKFSAWGGYRQRLYNAYSASEGEPGNGYHGIGLADAGATVTTSFARIYDTDWGTLSRIRHAIVPEVGYNYVQSNGQGTLPFFDFNDRVLGQSMTTWAITNYLTGKFRQGDAPPVYRDLLYLRLSQGYQISGARRDLLTLVPDVEQRLTDIRIEANFTPLKGLSLFTDSRYNTYETRFSTAMAGLELVDGKENTARFSYHFSRDRVEYLMGKFEVTLLKPFVFKYLSRYSIDKGGFLELSPAVEYKQQCWSVELSYHNRPVEGDKAFFINFTMAGIGPLGKLKTF
ncbi:MAG TPA: LPS assembly protein LptD [Geobacteraceae bacterium]|nr:LPS assembly protein LptD [Geobacteraceae bacterium]